VTRHSKSTLKAAPPRPEFAREVALEAVSARGYRTAIEANAAERAALAGRFGLLAPDRLAAKLELIREGGGEVRVAGAFEADVVQSCVVTLEPVVDHVAESFEVVFSPEAAAQDEGGEEALDEAMPEPLAGDAIDVGELVAQQLALSLDPYPRRPGATVKARLAELGLPESVGSDEGRGPFGALGRLKERRSGGD